MRIIEKAAIDSWEKNRVVSLGIGRISSAIFMIESAMWNGRPIFSLS
jgi:hypothetical protein